ncbi:TetR/AcrR family transcriptional regulator [Secundilactobacillus malefermentans]|uniref:TetR/AcrR family transcriptional regulator n=1 Tax=Secundilactobacillus malefermentans TaxID=176292 RepID=UPI0011CBD0E8|nr:TetR/AcrR family transcriptional regulator [Secundilactobacillus malefermentans]QEA31614.1 TetR/AcrR family transcriptional regulator [Secundilactobacillus malefermentans]
MATQQERKKQRRNQIKAAAQKLLFEKGYQATSIADIAKVAEISPVTLYKYFESKDQIGEEIVLSLINDGYADYQKMIDNEKISFEDLIKMMMRGGVGMTSNMSVGFYKFIVKELRENETVKAAYNDRKGYFWNSLIKRGRDAGLISPTISNAALMVYLDMYIQYAQNPINKDQYEAHSEVMLSMSEELNHLFFYGFMGVPKEENKE